MQIEELVDKVKSSDGIQTPEIYSEVCSWCANNIDTMNLDSEAQRYLYDAAITYMMNDKYESLDEKDASVLITYLAKDYLHKEGISDFVKKIKIISAPEEWEKNIKRRKSLKDTRAYYDSELHEIVYGPDVLENITSGRLGGLIRGIVTSIHEATHAKQWAYMEKTEINGNPIKYTAEMYLMTLEGIVKDLDKKFYEPNYKKLLIENMANKEGHIVLGGLMKKYLSDSSIDVDAFINYILEKQQYDEKSFEDLEIFGRNREKIQGLESACSKAISRTPEILKKYPILSLKYGENGIRKNIKTLLRDREARLQTGQDIQEVNELYKTLTSFGIREIPIREMKTGAPYEIRHIYNTMLRGVRKFTDSYRLMVDGEKGSIFDVMIRVNPEIQGIQQYIRETGTEDEFVYELLEERLTTKKVPQEKVEGIIARQKQIAEQKRRQIESQQGQAKKGNETTVAMWLNRGKNWSGAIDRVSQTTKAKFIQMKSDIVRTIRERVLSKDKTKETDETLENSNDK